MADDIGGATQWISNNINILTNIANTLEPVERLVTGAAYLIGISFAFKAIYVLKVYGEARTMMSTNSSLKEPILYLVVAAIFIYFPTGLEVILNTTFGYSSVLQYAPVNSGNSTLNSIFGTGSAAGRPVALIIQVIGLFAFIKGWVLVARSGSQGGQPGGMGKGFMHVFGGILAMNIVGTLQIVNNTLYG